MSVDLSLVVCTVGRKKPLERLLDSLSKQRHTRFEVVLVDQNEDGYLDAVLGRFSSLPIIHVRSARGLSRARNAGLARCRGAIVGFPDDDVWYGEGVTEAVVAFFTDRPEYAILSGRSVDRHGVPVTRQLPENADITRANVFLAGNSNTVFVLGSLAIDVGFDEALGLGAGTPFQSGEETDFLLRCLAKDVRGFYDRDLTIFHDSEGNQPPKARAARARKYAVGFGHLIRRHGYSLRFLAAILFRAGVRGGVYLLQGDVDGARERFAWIRGALQGYAAPLPR